MRHFIYIVTNFHDQDSKTHDVVAMRDETEPKGGQGTFPRSSLISSRPGIQLNDHLTPEMASQPQTLFWSGGSNAVFYEHEQRPFGRVILQGPPFSSLPTISSIVPAWPLKMLSM